VRGRKLAVGPGGGTAHESSQQLRLHELRQVLRIGRSAALGRPRRRPLGLRRLSYRLANPPARRHRNHERWLARGRPVVALGYSSQPTALLALV